MNATIREKLLVQEEMLEIAKSKAQLIIGLPMESSFQETGSY